MTRAFVMEGLVEGFWKKADRKSGVRGGAET